MPLLLASFVESHVYMRYAAQLDALHDQVIGKRLGKIRGMPDIDREVLPCLDLPGVNDIRRTRAESGPEHEGAIPIFLP